MPSYKCLNLNCLEAHIIIHSLSDHITILWIQIINNLGKKWLNIKKNSLIFSYSIYSTPRKYFADTIYNLPAYFNQIF